MELYTQQYEKNRKVAEQTAKLQESITATEREVMELVRVAEERLRKDWDAYREESERRWKNQEMVIEENRNRQEAKNKEFLVRFEALEESLRGLREEISSLRKAQEEWLRKVLSAFQEFLAATIGG